MSHKRHKSERSDKRHSSSHSSSYSSSKPSKYEDYDELQSGSTKEVYRHSFNYEKHKFVLNKLFFFDNEVLRVGTKEYDEFWPFLRKYQSTEEKAIQMNKQKHYYESIERKLSDLAFKMPKEWSDVSQLMAKTSSVNDLDDRYYIRNSLSAERVLDFRNICLFYLDFLDKQKEKALEKLRQMQKDLPIYQHKEEILDAVQRHSVVLIAGDTGCGKSTQVPQYLLNSGFENICCTQPRRIACISLRKRVAYETHNEFGTQIGYQIRFERSKSKHTKMLFLTEGLLLRQTSTDPMLKNYNVIILDEVHERHLSCDFLLGVMKCLVHQRKHDLKVILMSATINIELFSQYFGNCPIIQVPGRLYPIEVKYFPIPKTKFSSEKTKSKIDGSPYLRILQMIDDKYDSKERGDLLVFLSGLSEITIVSDLLKQYAYESNKWIILHLHSTLSIEEQDKVFDIAPEGVRKCILSTNIAETSLTIDGIRFVCDSGRVKEMSYDSDCRMQRLQEFWISVASAEQRKGRAGRTGPGVCYRLYSENDFNAFKAHTTPEIRRVPLHSLLLSMISMGLPDARKFPFLEPPNPQSVEEALNSLKEQSALTDSEDLTPMGKMLARLPVDITIGKMLILSSVFDITEPILSLAAALSVQSPITNQSLHDRDALESRRSLQSTDGDPFTLLNCYNKWLEIKSEEQNSRKWCKKRGLEEQRFYEMTKLRQQFKDILKDSGLLDESGDTTHMSSSDRIKRHGEVRLLRKMKKEVDRKAPKRRKLLKIDGERDDESDDNHLDVKDIEFRLSHDKRQVEALRDRSKQYSHRDITLMKLILCNGLHPQLAVADEHNSYKQDSDQMFHTKDKPFAVLHPNSIFALEPDLLKMSHSEEQIKGFLSFGAISNSHQLIAYVSLLETTKPYLCNCVRIPAAHVLLLVSNSIDTNYDFSRIVCDSWLELQFPDSQSSQKFISQALRVRDLWLQLLHRLFNECFETTDGDNDRSKARSPEVRQMQTQLVKEIHNFIRIEMKFSLRRLLKADTKHLYVGKTPQQLSLTTDLMRNQLFSDCAKQSDEYRVHPIKGGLQIRTYLTYNCLSTNESLEYLKYLKKTWICDICGKELASTPLEQIRHREKCQPKEGSVSDECKVESQDMDESMTSTSEAYDPLKIPYFCDECKQKLFMTSTQILKHKRNHRLNSSESKTTTNSTDNQIVIKSE